MGAGQSVGTEIGGSNMGYQVLRVYPNSPGSRAGLKAYFDFIVAIGNTRFSKENGSLREILKASVDQKLKMMVLNTRTRKVREVEIVPSTSWGGNGLLGVSIKHSSFERADERVWHVVEVEPGSPAFQAGFKANEDYVIGSDSILQENDDLYNLVEAHEGKALKLFLYNIKSDNCREVICHPNSKWGGKGYLGCEFGHGLLHRIPYLDEKEGISSNPGAPLLRNEQPPATQENDQSNKPVTFQNYMMNAQMHLLQQPTQPGQQLFQKALFDQTAVPKFEQDQSNLTPQVQPSKPYGDQQLIQQPAYRPQSTQPGQQLFQQTLFDQTSATNFAQNQPNSNSQVYLPKPFVDQHQNQIPPSAQSHLPELHIEHLQNLSIPHPQFPPSKPYADQQQIQQPVYRPQSNQPGQQLFQQALFDQTSGTNFSQNQPNPNPQDHLYKANVDQQQIQQPIYRPQSVQSDQQQLFQHTLSNQTSATNFISNHPSPNPQGHLYKSHVDQYQNVSNPNPQVQPSKPYAEQQQIQQSVYGQQPAHTDQQLFQQAPFDQTSAGNFAQNQPIPNPQEHLYKPHVDQHQNQPIPSSSTT